MTFAIRKRKTRRFEGQLPKFFAPKIPDSVATSAKIVHWDLFNRMVTGQADAADLWDWIETGYTYCKLAELHQEDGTEFTGAIGILDRQVDIFDAVLQRWKRTGKVGFSGPEMAIAREACEVYDALIEIDRHGLTAKAGQWAVQVMASIRKMECNAMGKPA